MIEVFKTNVGDQADARMLTDFIRSLFDHYDVSFDLEDCDSILRIESSDGSVQSFHVISMLISMGFDAEVLEDENPPLSHLLLFDNRHYPVC